MNELTNQVVSNGTYDSIPTSLTSNTSVVSLIDGLTLKLESDKNKWVNGNLTYTVTLSNLTESAYTNVVITDTINPTYAVFVEGSVKLDSEVYSSDKYTYDKSSGLLTINLDDVNANIVKVITFEVSKKS